MYVYCPSTFDSAHALARYRTVSYIYIMDAQSGLDIFKNDLAKQSTLAIMTASPPINIHRHHRYLIIATLFLFVVNAACGQKISTITGLALDGKSANSVTMTILLPNKGGNKTIANINDKLPDGTRLIIPNRVIVKLQSPGGTQVIKGTGSQAIEYTVGFTNQGEHHTVKGIGAQIENIVKKITGYNYRNTNEKGTTAASKGTIFIYTDFSAETMDKAIIATSEGSILIIDKVPCTINGQPIKNNRQSGVATKSASQLQAAGHGEYSSTNNPIDYPDLEAGVRYTINKMANKTDPEDIAGDLMCLGDLYMAMARPAQAIEPFNKAAGYYESIYGINNLSAIDARLASALAYKQSKNNVRASMIVWKSITILKKSLDRSINDLEFSRLHSDTNATVFICKNIAELNGFLGWAYALKGDQKMSAAYFQKASATCN